MFDQLHELATRRQLKCSACSSSTRLRLRFKLALGVKHPVMTVRACFVPKNPETWRYEKKGVDVVFYPFLVVGKRHGRDDAVWMPYWHRIGGRLKPGQFAPFMDQPLFDDLLKQARRRGYLKGTTKGPLASRIVGI